MNDALRRSFLDDIKTNPLDPAPRLIFADWLEEQAVHEAEYARAALLRLSAHELQMPPPLNGLFGTESRNLWNRYRRSWLGPIHQVSGVRAVCISGLIHLEVTVTGWMSRPMRMFAESPGWDWVAGLTVTGYDQRIDRVWARSWLDTVARFRLRCNRHFLRGRWAALFASSHLGGVRELELNAQISEPADIAQLAAWPGLEKVHSLNLASNGLDADVLHALLASPHLRGLRRLDLSSCGLTRVAFARLCNAENLAGLEELFLGVNDLSAAVLGPLEDATFGPSLRLLQIGQNPLGDAGAVHLAQCRLPALKTLRISSGGIGPAGATALSQAPWLPQLEQLTADYNPIATAGADLLRGPLDHLRSLSLRHANLTPDAAQTLAATALGKLQAIDLHNNLLLGDSIASALAGNASLGELRWLDLGACSMTNVGANTLARWSALPRLDLLALESNRLEDDGLRALIGVPGRRASAIWRLYGNQPSRGLRMELRQRAPALAL